MLPRTKIDWSVSLGAGTIAPNQYAAKYSFDINATPDCTNDFVVYGLNAAGITGGQANLVGFNNLYSGSTPSTGICGSGSATVYWAYNGSTAGGSVLTSPVVSLDGKKVAYVESASSAAVFHVLTWVAGQGTSATAAAAPVAAGTCTTTSSCIQSLTFSTSSTATLASPWIDYTSDKAFVASDDGKIYRISCVFRCTLNTNPVVDWTFTLPVAGTGGTAIKPAGPVYDGYSGLLYVADQLGEIWAINAGGSSPSLAAGPVMVGGGGCLVTNPPGRTGTAAPCTSNGGSFGITDSPILDVSTGKLYAFSGNDGAGAVVAQLKSSDLTGLVKAHVGGGNVANNSNNVDLHAGAFDNSYWTASASAGHLFVCGNNTSNTQPFLWRIGFAAYPTMDSTATQAPSHLASVSVGCTPLTEFYNPDVALGGVAANHDLLVSSVQGNGSSGFIQTNDISSGSLTTVVAEVGYSGGTSGIVVDNVSTAAQASSLYFATQATGTGSCGSGAYCAVKLTQLALQ